MGRKSKMDMDKARHMLRYLGDEEEQGKETERGRENERYVIKRYRVTD